MPRLLSFLLSINYIHWLDAPQAFSSLGWTISALSASLHHVHNTLLDPCQYVHGQFTLGALDPALQVCFPCAEQSAGWRFTSLHPWAMLVLRQGRILVAFWINRAQEGVISWCSRCNFEARSITCLRQKESTNTHQCLKYLLKMRQLPLK